MCCHSSASHTVSRKRGRERRRAFSRVPSFLFRKGSLNGVTVQFQGLAEDRGLMAGRVLGLCVLVASVGQVRGTTLYSRSAVQSGLNQGLVLSHNLFNVLISGSVKSEFALDTLFHL